MSFLKRFFPLAFAILAAGLMISGCGGTGVQADGTSGSSDPGATPTPTPSSSPTPEPTPTPTPTLPTEFPHSNHVLVVMLENQDFSQVFPGGDAGECSQSAMPFLCHLAAANGLALEFYSNAHGSLRAYLFNTSGSDWPEKPFDCNGDGCAGAGVITGDNLVRAITAADKTWRAYLEDIPARGYMGGSVGPYAAEHNPFKWYANVADSAAQRANMVPFSQFAEDLKAESFADFSYVVPSELHDAEGLGNQSAGELLAVADDWLKTNISPLFSTSPFQVGGDGILMVTFDEGKVAGKSGDSSSDDSCSPTQRSGCGGHIAFVMVGPSVISGSTSAHVYHFQDMLHTIIHLLGLPDYMNAAREATDIALLPGVDH